MKTRRAIIGGAGALLLAGLGYRAWDRGVFTGATGAPFAPWDAWRGSEADGKRRPLRAAILAANPHDTQPWLFQAEGDTITVFADRARHLGSFDPFRREMHMGLGAAIENLVRAAGAFGMAAAVEPVQGHLTLSPGPEPVAAARIALTAAQPARDELFEAIPRRHTNRGPYRADQAIAGARLQQLAALAAGDALRVAFIVDGGARKEMGALIVEATQRIIADAEMSADSFRWIRTGRREILAHRDGITIDTSGTPPLLTVAGKLMPDQDAASTDSIWLGMTRDTHVATAPVLGIMLVRDRLDMAQALAVGRAWQRLHLAATVQGLAAQPLNQPAECIDRNIVLGRPDTFSVALVQFAGADGWQPVFAFRMGVAEKEAARSPRRPLEDVLRSA